MSLIKKENFSLTPTTLEEAMKYADLLAKSSIVPKNYQNRAGDILVAIQMGGELGLKPMQSLQNISVINGKPALWGDSMLALVSNHAEFENIEEYFENGNAVCIIKRRNRSPCRREYTIDMAKKAGLWNKPGVWQNYPERMLQMRARGFALRDTFADALCGLVTVEEARDYPAEDKTPSKVMTLSERLEAANNSYKKPEPIVLKTVEEVQEEQEVSEQSSPVDRSELLKNLNELIYKKSVDQEVVDKWLKKAGVEWLDELSTEQIENCIRFLEAK
jgi:hypothetical protein